MPLGVDNTHTGSQELFLFCNVQNSSGGRNATKFLYGKGQMMLFGSAQNWERYIFMLQGYFTR